MTEHSLSDLRERIRLLDLELVERAAERVALARRVGESKRRENRATVDYAQERDVLDRARNDAIKLGLDPRVAEELFMGLIRASVTAQEEDSLRHAATGVGQTAVVVGGAGRMGRWMIRFLSAQGFRVGALDSAAPPDETEWARNALPSADLIVMSTPPATTAALYAEWTSDPPAGVVVDIASIKSPLIEPIRRLRQAGCRVASIHPMFGPSTFLLRDADMVICETGDPAAMAVVERLFLPTSVNLVRLPIVEHDRMMADLLSLAHATAIAFALALPETEHPIRSTTFRALESLAATLVRESPEVYYEIQNGNPHSSDSIARLRLALDRIVATLEAGDPMLFRELFEDGRRRTNGPG